MIGGFYLGKWFGITVRMHWTLLLFGWFQVSRMPGHYGLGLAIVATMYLCILLHEFGHSLAARWCDGHSDEIVLWPLGGIAFCRVPYSPSANLITAVAGPLVTLVIWGGLALITPHMPLSELSLFLTIIQYLNGWLLVFNLIPAFPMDGGRILRDTLWFFLGCRRASEIAFWLGRLMGTAMIVYGIYLFITQRDGLMLALIGFFQLTSIPNVDALVAQAGGTGRSFSVRDRLKRGSRAREFEEALSGGGAPVHQCVVCGRTEFSDPNLHFVFRTSPDGLDGDEYCEDHVPPKAE